MVGNGDPFTLHSRLISCLRMAETSRGEPDPTMVGGTEGLSSEEAVSHIKRVKRINDVDLSVLT